MTGGRRVAGCASRPARWVVDSLLEARGIHVRCGV